MLDVNMIIANNIQAELKKENKKQVDLAEGIGVSKQTISWDLRLYEKTSVKNGMTGNWICVLVRVLMRLNWRSSQSRTRLSA